LAIISAVFVAKFDFWLAFGLVAQLPFTARFLVQWISSERAGQSVVPMAFWFFSMGGGFDPDLRHRQARAGDHSRAGFGDAHLRPQHHADREEPRFRLEGREGIEVTSCVIPGAQRANPNPAELIEIRINALCACPE
jgi:hypothetical protein